jgi:two-component system NarL family sensor kinase
VRRQPTVFAVTGNARVRRSDVVLGGCAALCVATFVVGLVALAGLTVDDNPYDTYQYALGVPCVLMGVYVAHRAPRHGIGWLMVFAGWGVWCTAAGYAVLTRPWIHTEWVARSVFAVSTMGWVWCRGVLLVLVPLLYPASDAFTRSVRPLRRTFAWIAVAVIAAACATQAITQVTIDFETGELPTWTEPFQRIHPWTMRAVFASAIFAATDLLIRVWRMDATAARRHRPIALAAAVLMAPSLIELASAAGIGDGFTLDWVEFAATGLFVVVLGYGVVRHDVLGFHTVVRRTVLYGGITLVSAALYVAVVGVFAAMLSDGVGWGPVVATGVVAISLQPVRTLTQRFVDRWVFGDRHEPYRALAGLGRRLGDASSGDPLHVVAEAVRASLRVPAVSIEVAGDNGPVVVAHAAGAGEAAELLRVPIVFERRTVGVLVITQAEGDPSPGADEQRLLRDLASAAGAVVESALLAAELGRSREQLVRAREEERRRLRHDLHDGLGPTLASVAMGLDVAASRLEGEPELAALLHDLDRALQEGIADIRRVVYGLRPPALDELGLVAAVQEQARDMATRARRADGRGNLAIDVCAENLPPLGAAVEVAAYRIVVEAMTNVLRHSGASNCRVRLSAGDALEVAVEDDGRGIDVEGPIGVGLESMRNRAEELGGRVEVGRRHEGGTLLFAALPLRGAVGL